MRKSTIGFLKTISEELRVFSTQEKGEVGLRANGFTYRPVTFFKGDPLCWCHEDNVALQYIDVEFLDLDVNSEAEILCLQTWRGNLSYLAEISDLVKSRRID